MKASLEFNLNDFDEHEEFKRYINAKEENINLKSALQEIAHKLRTIIKHEDLDNLTKVFTISPSLSACVIFIPLTIKIYNQR